MENNQSRGEKNHNKRKRSRRSSTESEDTPADETRFLCKVCGRSFAKVTELIEHLVWHSGWNVFKCNNCQKKCSSLSSLYNHNKSHEKTNTLVQSSPKEAKTESESFTGDASTQSSVAPCAARTFSSSQRLLALRSMCSSDPNAELLRNDHISRPHHNQSNDQNPHQHQQQPQLLVVDQQQQETKDEYQQKQGLTEEGQEESKRKENVQQQLEEQPEPEEHKEP